MATVLPSSVREVGVVVVDTRRVTSDDRASLIELGRAAACPARCAAARRRTTRSPWAPCAARAARGRTRAARPRRRRRRRAARRARRPPAPLRVARGRARAARRPPGAPSSACSTSLRAPRSRRRDDHVVGAADTCRCPSLVDAAEVAGAQPAVRRRPRRARRSGPRTRISPSSSIRTSVAEDRRARPLPGRSRGLAAAASSRPASTPRSGRRSARTGTPASSARSSSAGGSRAAAEQHAAQAGAVGARRRAGARASSGRARRSSAAPLVDARRRAPGRSARARSRCPVERAAQHDRQAADVVQRQQHSQRSVGVDAEPARRSRARSTGGCRRSARPASARRRAGRVDHAVRPPRCPRRRRARRPRLAARRAPRPGRARRARAAAPSSSALGSRRRARAGRAAPRTAPSMARPCSARRSRAAGRQHERDAVARRDARPREPARGGDRVRSSSAYDRVRVAGDQRGLVRHAPRPRAQARGRVSSYAALGASL